MVTKTKFTLPKGTKIPKHVVIIPDGNRRWARARNLPTFEGHRKGFKRAVEVSRAARDIGIKTLTLWGFSTENWDRTKEEIGYLMKLYEKIVDDYLKDAKKEGVRIYHLGRKDRLPKSLLEKIIHAEEVTRKNSKYVMNIAIDYGGQDEILRGIRKLIGDKVSSSKVNTKLFERYLDTAGQPRLDVDLIIRTSDEQRTSGIMLWHSAYAETYWEDCHFPDFTPEKLFAAVVDYSRRRRRFGGNDKTRHFGFDPELVAELQIAWWKLRKDPQGSRLRDLIIESLKKQYGLSKKIASEAARYFIEAMSEENNGKNWERAKGKMKSFYRLIKSQVKLALEPSFAASLEVKLWQNLALKQDEATASEAEKTAKELYAEVYRISLLQAASAARFMVLAHIERNLAEGGLGEEHWKKAEDYLVKFYSALKDRVA